MTAADWPASADPLALYRHLRGRPATAPSRWFGLVIGLPPTLPAAKLRQLLDAACDRPAADPAVSDMRAAVRSALTDSDPVASLAALLFAFGKLEPQATAGAVYDQLLLTLLADNQPDPALAADIRCLFADPAHPPPRPLPWRTATAVQIAAGVEADGAFDRLPVLADALEDAGCDHAPLLAHLRSPDLHRPGCHALDAVLGR